MRRRRGGECQNEDVGVCFFGDPLLETNQRAVPPKKTDRRWGPWISEPGAPSCRHRGFGFVTFKDPKSVEAKAFFFLPFFFTTKSARVKSQIILSKRKIKSA